MSGAPRPSPRAAAPLLLGALIGALGAGRLESALLCLSVAVLLGNAIGAPWPSAAWRRAVGLAALTALALNLYLVPGLPLPLPRIAGAPATDRGLAMGVLFALRLAGAAAALHALRTAWPGERAADEAARLLRPLQRLGVPVEDARVMLGLAVRFAPLLAAETQRIARLQEQRAGGPPRSLAERIRRRRAVAVPALVHTLERAEQLALALEARHYRVRPLTRERGPAWGWTALALALPGVSWFWRGT